MKVNDPLLSNQGIQIFDNGDLPSTVLIPDLNNPVEDEEFKVREEQRGLDVYQLHVVD